MTVTGSVPSSGWRRPLRKVTRALHAFSGWLVAYVVAGAVLGLAFWTPLRQEPACIPRITVFAVLETNCPNALVDHFWTVAVEIPRVAVVVIAMPLALAWRGIAGGNMSYAMNARPWLRVTVPLLLVIGAGTIWWWKRSKAVAGVSTAFLTAVVSYLAYLA